MKRPNKVQKFLVCFMAILLTVNVIWQDAAYVFAAEVQKGTSKAQTKSAKEQSPETKTPVEEVTPDGALDAKSAKDKDASEPEVVSSATSMDYYRAVSELVKGADEMVVSSSSDSYKGARLLIKGDSGMDFSQYEGVCKVVMDGEGHYTVQFSDSNLAKEAANELNKLESIDYAEPDEEIAISAVESDSVEKRTEDSENLSGVMAATEHKSWGISQIGVDEYAAYARTISTRTVKVAVVDTGVDASHTYLAGRVLSGYDFVDNDSNPADENYHGTHVAGTVVDCTMGLSNIKILPVRVLNSQGKGYHSMIVSGIRYAADQGASVINLSLGGGHSSVMDEAVSYATSRGALCVVSAGNDNENTNGACPAHIEEAVTVSAIDSSKRKASFSNYGSAVDLCAPGVDINSCVPGGRYRSLNGTSMAAPHASACAALLKLAHASYTPAQLQQAMKESCIDLGASGWDSYYGQGLIDLRQSIHEDDPVTVTASESSVVLNLGSNSSKTITITAGGALPSRYYLNCNYKASGSGFECAWTGSWRGNSHDLTITALEAGRGTITISVKDSENESILATTQIEVTVGSVRYPTGGTVTDWRDLESAHDYAGSSDYTWTYTADTACRSMALTFSQNTETEENYDRILIYTGSATDENNTLVGSYTGTQLAGQTINVPGQTVKIRLTSDGTINKYGFKVTNLETAGGRYDEGGTVTDWHDLESRHNYQNDADYTWVYTYPEDTDSLNVTFSEETKIESNWDHLYIYTGDGTQIGEYSGTELSGQTVNVPGRTVKIRLVSDGTVNFYGFRVSDLMAGGNGNKETIVDDWRELESPHLYEDNCDHTWIYTYPKEAEELLVTFSDNTEVENRWDHIYIYTEDGSQVGDYTGNELAGQTVSVQGRTVKIRLTSDDSISYYGFKVTNVEEAGSGEKYPESEHEYPDDYDRTWIWEGPQDAQSLDVAFDERTEVEEGFDFIYIYNGSDTLLGEYTGTELAGARINVPGNKVKIRLVSDSSYSAYGFKVTEIVPIRTQVTVTAANVSVYSGALVEVPVNIANNPGIAGASLDIGFDENLMTLVSAEPGPVMSSGTFSANRNIVSWYNDQNVTANGTLFTLKFRVDANADRGDTQVTIALHGSKKNLVDENSNYIEAIYQNCTASILGGRMGDMTGDGDLTIGDVVCLNRFHNELIELDDRQLRLADVDGDGEYAIGDLVRLYRIVLGRISQSLDVGGSILEDIDPQGKVNIRVGSASASRGSVVTLPVEISENCGIAGLVFSVGIPEGCSLVSIERGELLGGKGTFEIRENDVLWFNEENITDDGVLFYIKLAVGQGALTGNVSVSLKDNKPNLTNKNSSIIGADFTEGTVAVRVNMQDVTVDAIPAQAYTGRALQPAVAVWDGTRRLTQNVDYTLSYANNVNVGTASVTITGKGSYFGSITRDFVIAAPQTQNPGQQQSQKPNSPSQKPGSQSGQKTTAKPKVKIGKIYTVGNLKYKAAKNSVTVVGAKNRNIKSLTIKNTVKIYGKTYKVTAIANKAFKGYSKLQNVKIGTNVTKIGNEAFCGNRKLKKVTISSKSLKSIGSRAFYKCSRLSSIRIKSTKLRTVGKQAFKGISPSARVLVPSGKLSAYRKLLKGKI